MQLPETQSSVHVVRVWDLPTRLFHWLLLLSVTGSVVSAKLGGNAMVWHFRLGLLALVLLGFRLLWGVIGGRWSRFASFVHAPATVWRYVRGVHQRQEHLDVGHSPTGGLSVLALLLILLVQVGTGLVADDEIASTGPLVSWVSGAVSGLATAWHKTWGQWALFGLVGLHVLAIGFYRWRKRIDLIGPMLHGDKSLPAPAPASADGWKQRLLASVVAAAMAGVAWWVSRQGA